jgi:hypothetical protein
MTPGRTTLRPERGGVLIECAVLLPFLLLLTLPVVDYARTILAHLVLNDAVRAVAAELAREPAVQPLPQRLQQIAEAQGPARDRCFLVTQLVGDGSGGDGGTVVRAQALWPALCRHDAAARAMLARRDLPWLAPGQVAYVVEASRTLPPIFLRGVLMAVAPPADIQARVVF